MTHYQKIATLIFRILAVLAMFIGVVSWLVVAITAFFLTHTGFVLATFIAPGLYLIVGMLLFSVSRFLAIWICLDFDELKKR